MKGNIQSTKNKPAMKSFSINALYALMILSFSSCEVIGGIFKAGMGVGIFMVVIVVAIVIYIISRIGRSKQ